MSLHEAHFKASPTSTLLLGRLMHLKAAGPDIVNEGICYNLGGLSKSEQELMTRLMHEWPLRSDNKFFVVPSSAADRSEHKAYIYYYTNAGLWDKTTEYGRLRWELLDYLIKRLSK